MTAGVDRFASVRRPLGAVLVLLGLLASAVSVDRAPCAAADEELDLLLELLDGSEEEQGRSWMVTALLLRSGGCRVLVQGVGVGATQPEQFLLPLFDAFECVDVEGRQLLSGTPVGDLDPDTFSPADHRALAKGLGALEPMASDAYLAASRQDKARMAALRRLVNHSVPYRNEVPSNKRPLFGAGTVAHYVAEGAVRLEMEQQVTRVRTLLETYDALATDPPRGPVKRALRDLAKALESLDEQTIALAGLVELGVQIRDIMERVEEDGADEELVDAQRLQSQFVRGWKRMMHPLVDAVGKIEKAAPVIEAEIERLLQSGDAMPSDFFATVDPGEYYALLLVNNGYIPNGWEWARVGNGKQSVASRDQLWTLVSSAVSDAERDFAGTFGALYQGALGHDSRGVRLSNGEYVSVAEFLAMDAQAVAEAAGRYWAFQDDISYPEWDGYLATRNYHDAGGVTRARIVVGFIRADTPPVIQPLQDNVTPGEYQFTHALVQGPLENGEVFVPARTVRVTEIVDFYDELLAEMETARTSFASDFEPLVHQDDVAEVQFRHDVLNSCGAAIYPRGILDTTRAPLFVFLQVYLCPESSENPFPRQVYVTVGFERIGD